MKQTYITVTNAEFYDTLKEDAEAEGATVWTVGKHVKRGDQIPLYVGKPVMAIVAVGEASEDAWLDDDPGSEWFDHYFIEIHGLRMLEHPVTRAELLRQFPEWGWPKMPGCGVRVPPQLLVKLDGLLKLASQ